MLPFGSIKRRKLIGYLQMLGRERTHIAGKTPTHEKGDITLTIPNPHQGDISKGLLARILREAGISREEWEE